MHKNKGKISPFRKTHEEYVKEVSRIFPDIEILEEYTTSSTKIKLKTRYGICITPARGVCRGQYPAISSAINPTEYFIAQARETHGDLYDYSKTIYTHSRTKVIIICKDHGEFLQEPRVHLSGNGCVHCGLDKLGWSYSNWEEKGLNSRNFDGFKFYILKCFNEKESFYKIGKTFVKLNARYACFSMMPYKWEIIETLDSDSKSISMLEQSMKAKNISHRYKPLINFWGETECFSKIQFGNNIVYS